MRAWRFINGERKLNNSNNIIKLNTLYTTNRTPELHTYELEGFIKPLDALKHANGPIVCRVDIDRNIVRDEDRIAGQIMEVLWMADATEIIRKFARLCALDVITLWLGPDITAKYLRTGNEDIREDAKAATLDTQFMPNQQGELCAGRAAESAIYSAENKTADPAFLARCSAENAEEAAERVGWHDISTKQNQRLQRMLQKLGVSVRDNEN